MGFSILGGMVGVGASMLFGAAIAPVVGMGLVGVAAGRLAGASYRAASDPFRTHVLPADESLADIKADVDSAMGKIKALLAEHQEVAGNLDKKGRDHWFYARGSKLGPLVSTWKPDRWKLTETAGLLLDLQSALKKTTLHGDPEDRNALSKKQRKIRKKGYQGSTFGRQMARLGDTQANPSATTANLLTFLRVNQQATGITAKEIEAIMQAAILFWEGGLKRSTGDFHTGMEVWMAYDQHLEKQREEEKKEK